MGRLTGCQSYVVAAFTSVAAYRGTVGMLGGELPHALETLISSGKPVALIALGNPYVLRNFGKVTAYLATYSNVAPSEIAAARAILGEIDIAGICRSPFRGRPPTARGSSCGPRARFHPAALRNEKVN